MSTFDNTGQTRPEPNPEERIAFCQHCGKPLYADTVRRVGSAVYCEPCLEARLGAAPGTQPPPPGYTPVDPVAANWKASVHSGTPNPGLAALLGFIPGVGAMYNEQYAKGIVHLLVFAVLIRLADVSGLFGICIPGWILYMVIEAHHTARARRDGTPLPNPFGLNDIGERMGFGRAWSPNPYTPPAPPYAAPVDPAQPVTPPPTPDPYASQYAAHATQQAYQQAYRDPGWGAPTDTYAYGPPIPPVPPMPPYASGYVPVGSADPGPMPYVPPRNRFPAGAIWLIGLGLLFLCGDMGVFHFLSFTVIAGLALIGLGAWIFVRKLTETGHGLADDGTPLYRLRLYRALRSAIWLLAIGCIVLLNGLHLMRWQHSWPWFLILAGILTLLERATYSSFAGTPMPPAPGPTHSAPAATSSITPFTRRDEEER